MCKTGDYIINCTNMRERAKRASALEFAWTAARPVATIVYITLIIFDRIV